jgi:hypothetical protein
MMFRTLLHFEIHPNVENSFIATGQPLQYTLSSSGHPVIISTIYSRCFAAAASCAYANIYTR